MLGRSLPAETSTQIRSEVETVDEVEAVIAVVAVVTEVADWSTTEL